MNKDEWIVEKFTSGEYEATNCGVLISRNAYRRAIGRKLKTTVHPKTGYEQIVLWDKNDKKGVMCLVHRIVALIHIPNPDNLPHVNHKDGDKTNNAASNLEWCSASDNAIHAYKTGLRSAAGENNGQSKLTEANVLSIRHLRGCGKKYKELGEMFNVHPMTIGEICRREIWRHI